MLLDIKVCLNCIYFFTGTKSFAITTVFIVVETRKPKPPYFLDFLHESYFRPFLFSLTSVFNERKNCLGEIRHIQQLIMLVGNSPERLHV